MKKLSTLMITMIVLFIGFIFLMVFEYEKPREESQKEKNNVVKKDVKHVVDTPSLYNTIGNKISLDSAVSLFNKNQKEIKRMKELLSGSNNKSDSILLGFKIKNKEKQNQQILKEYHDFKDKIKNFKK
jgi:hypothetical protein